jgi:meso-butanediol dehydrogenase/(S,S)-butanediol dehydrogenase/diacetyl reductase
VFASSPGAARGIGRAIAEALLDEGAKVCIADINAEQAAEVAEANRAAPRTAQDAVMSFGVDVRDRAETREMIETTVRHFGRLDVMFNNAGVNKPMNFMDVTEENWSFIMDINGLGCLIGMQEAARQMIAQGGGGKIINTASIASPAGLSTTSRPIAPRNGPWSVADAIGGARPGQA